MERSAKWRENNVRRPDKMWQHSTGQSSRVGEVFSGWKSYTTTARVVASLKDFPLNTKKEYAGIS